MKKITRRKFMEDSGKVILVSGLSAMGLTNCAVTATYNVDVSGDRIILDTNIYPELGISNSGILIESAQLEDPILVINREGKSFVVVSAICTHMRCTVNIGDNAIICPCHGSTYDLDGNVVRGPAQQNLMKYKFENKSGVLEILIR